MTQKAIFNHILDLIDTLSLDEQEDLISIVRYRQDTYQPHPTANLSEEEREIARKRFEGHFGEIEPDKSTSVDNESIDADLAKEYAKNHEAD